MGAGVGDPPGQGHRWAGLHVVWLELYFSQSPFPSLPTMEHASPSRSIEQLPFSNHP